MSGKEEQDVLDFFSQAANLPLALSVSDHVDGIRQKLNSAFWLALHARVSSEVQSRALPWTLLATEDRNTPQSLVGLHLQPSQEQALFLRPMMEQQLMGDALRIYYGLMWSSAPTPDKSGLKEVAALRADLLAEGYKDNESYFAWQWTNYHPRRRDFLLRYTNDMEALLDDASALMLHFLVNHGERLLAANAALASAPPTMAVSLDQLRAKLKH